MSWLLIKLFSFMVFKTQEKQCVFVQVSQRGVCGQPSDHAGGAEHLQRRDAEADRGALQHPAVPRGGQQQAGQHQAGGWRGAAKRIIRILERWCIKRNGVANGSLHRPS